jgi:hypothetical protein
MVHVVVLAAAEAEVTALPSSWPGRCSLLVAVSLRASYG